jgi:hypothetical protein
MALTPRFWVIAETNLRAFLDRAHSGENVDFLMLELIANSEVAEPEDR